MCRRLVYDHVWKGLAAGLARLRYWIDVELINTVVMLLLFLVRRSDRRHR